MPQPSIAVIGAGFSGTLLSLALQSAAPAGTRILLIESAGCFATGAAYRTTNTNHLLNVPAGRMSAFHDRPLDFVHWLQREPKLHPDGAVPNESTFVSRGLYGAYLQHLLTRGLRRQRDTQLELVHDQVIGLEESPDRVTLLLASGIVISADLVVLAVGLPRSAISHPDVAVLEAAGVWRGDPWAPAACAALDPSAPVLLVGSGLSMVDTVISLLDSRHTGPIDAISRHGLLPRPHAAQLPAPVALPPLPSGLLPLVRYIRDQAARVPDWRSVIDALRPIVPDVWRGLTEREQHQFIRHLRSWWDVHRHRMTPQAENRIAAARASGQLRLRAGRIVDMALDDGLASITLRCRPEGTLHTLTVARVIDCTGHGCDMSRSATPLVRDLFRSGLAKPDRLNLGLEVTEKGALVNSAGVASLRLFAVGPLTRGNIWELTAVPELRRQCVNTGQHLGMRLAQLVESNRPMDDIAPWLRHISEKEPSILRSYEQN